MAKPKALSREEFTVFRKLQTRWADNDIYGHVNNVVHYSLFDTAVNGWLISLGLLDIPQGDTIGLVIESKCNFFAEIAFPDALVAGIRIAHIGNSSVQYEIALFRNDEEFAAAQGHFVHVYVNAKTRKPEELPKKWRLELDDYKR